MLKRSITPKLAADIIRLLLEERAWSVSRIARTIEAPIDYVCRVRAAKQSLLPKDLSALAKGCKEPVHVLVFSSFRPDEMPADLRGLYLSTQKVIESSDAFRRALQR